MGSPAGPSQLMPNDQTIITGCAPMYSFFSLNVARLLKSNSVNKSKINFLNDLSDESTLFVALCETFLNDNIFDAEIQMQGFNVCRTDRLSRPGGGVCFYIKDHIQFSTCLSFSNDMCEVLIVKLSNPQLVLINTYRPPNSTREAFEEIVSKIRLFIGELPTPLCDIIMLGDFNFPLIDWHSTGTCSTHANSLMELTNFLYLDQLVQIPTKGANILDLVFSNPLIIDNIDSIETSISDHNIIRAVTRIPKSPVKKECLNPVLSVFDHLNFNSANWSNINDALSNIGWNDELTNLSVDEMLSKITSVVGNICENNCKRKPGNRRRKSKFAYDRRKLIRKRSRIVNKISSHPRKNNSSLVAEVKQIDSDICDSHHNERLSEEHEATSKIASDPKFFYKFAKRSSKTKTSIGPLITNDNNLSDDPKVISELLLHQYNSVFSAPLATHIISDPVSFFNPVPQRNCLSTISVNEDLIIDVIKELSCNSAAGLDGVPVSLLKNSSVELAKPLNILFNHSINTGQVPSAWKEAAVVPIYKGGDRSLAKNYRPISLTSAMMKLLERLIRKQLVNFLSVHNLFNPNQHGFRHGRSCLSALLDVYDNMMTSLSNNPKSSVDMIYLDYAKAFDKVDHGVLLNKLKTFGICGKLGEWLHSFLTNRRHHVRIPGGVSKSDNVLSGVPQGTVLGPVLFLVLISDISNNVDSNITSFADDTKVFATINNPSDCDDLQSDLDNIYSWSSANNMMFNQEKFQYISYHMGDSSKINNIYLSPDHNILPKSGEVKDLGILMSENCDFDSHIASVAKKCSRLCGWILRTFSTRSKSVLLTLFKSIVLPHLDYGSQLWSPYKIKSINALEKVQRVFTKHIDGMHDLSYTERLKALQIYSLQRRRDRYMAIYIWKILEGNVPNFSPPIKCHISARRGRLCNSGVVPTGHLGTLCHNSFRSKAATIFNCLPKHIRDLVNCANTSIFKRALDYHLCSIEDSPIVPNECNSLTSRSKENAINKKWRAAIADQAE